MDTNTGRSTNPRTVSKNKWLQKCRQDPAKAQHLKDLRRKYYEAHREEEKAKALARYYQKKAVATPAPPAPPAPSDPPAPPA